MKRALKLCVYVCVCASHLYSVFAQHRQKRMREAFTAEEISFVTASWRTTAFVMGYFNLFNPTHDISHLKAHPCMACVYWYVMLENKTSPLLKIYLACQ